MAEHKMTTINIPYHSPHPVETSQDPAQTGATVHEVDTSVYAKEWCGYDSKVRVTNSEEIQEMYGVNDHDREEKEPN